jgi:uncharacterized protein (DUF952 family)
MRRARGRRTRSSAPAGDEVILHVTTRAAWEAAVAAGTPYAHPSLDSEGFVHCSTDAQLVGTLGRYFAGADRTTLVSLVVDPDRLGDEADLRWEPSTGGEDFPHVYGPIPLDAVVDVRPVG